MGKFSIVNRQSSIQSGFTLVEIMVVLGIIGILASATLITLNPIAQINKGKDVKRKTELSELQKTLQLYYADYGKYPDDSSNKILPQGSASPLNWGDAWAPYMQKLPKDPVGSKNYVYISPDPDNQMYLIYAHLEQKENDPQTCNYPNHPNCQSAPGQNACGSACNYGVSSPNTSP